MRKITGKKAKLCEPYIHYKISFIHFNNHIRRLPKGDIVEITGKVHHEIKDTYDFNEGELYDNIAFEKYRLLATKGYAKPFKVYGLKPQKMKGTMEIKNGRIVNAQFKWEDIRQ